MDVGEPVSISRSFSGDDVCAVTLTEEIGVPCSPELSLIICVINSLIKLINLLKVEMSDEELNPW